MGEFRMPSLGADMAHGTLMEWRVRPGDAVRRGDVVAQVETEKAAIEVEVWESGVVDEILVPVGTRVPVGTVLARIRPSADDAAAEAAPPPRAVPPPPPPEPAPAPRSIPAASIPIFRAPGPVPSPETPAASPAGGAAGHVRASPAARRLAESLGIDLSRVRGSGPRGAVVRADVERARGGAPAHGPRVSPVARRMAEEMGIDLAAVAGTGAGGAITKADVARAAGSRKASPPEPRAEAVAAAEDRSAAMRAAIAAAVAKSKREIPHYYLWTHVDLHRALAWLETENAGRPMEDRLLPAALLLKATALALRDFPEMNGFWTEGAFRPGGGIHLGVAVFLRGGGLVVPAILDADAKPLGALMRELGDVVRRARSGGLRGAEVASATITITNLGDRGVEGVLGVIYPPQVAVVGFGKIVERPWAEDGMVGVRPVAALTLAADHRASDGHRGSLFLEKVADLLQKPEEL